MQSIFTPPQTTHPSSPSPTNHSLPQPVPDRQIPPGPHQSVLRHQAPAVYYNPLRRNRFIRPRPGTTSRLLPPCLRLLCRRIQARAVARGASSASYLTLEGALRPRARAWPAAKMLVMTSPSLALGTFRSATIFHVTSTQGLDSFLSLFCHFFSLPRTWNVRLPTIALTHTILTRIRSLAAI
jgi:hypothetical protein